MNPRRLITLIYAVVLGALCLAGGAVILDARAQYKQLRQAELANRAKLAEARARLREEERILDRLKTDPAFVETAIRQRLRYAKPGEVIFRFNN